MVAFRDANDAKKAILRYSSADFFEKFLLGTDTPHFGADRLRFVADCLRDQYQITLEPQHLVVVGSSKLGFALHEKKKNGSILPAFRPFDQDSDVDLSLCCPDLFVALWHDLSAYQCKQSRVPVRHGNLGDYLTYGWLRRDHLPQEANLVKFNSLDRVLGRIRRDRTRGFPKLEFGLFYDVEHLRLYQMRSIELCRSNLENPL